MSAVTEASVGHATWKRTGGGRGDGRFGKVVHGKRNGGQHAGRGHDPGQARAAGSGCRRCGSGRLLDEIPDVGNVADALFRILLQASTEQASQHRRRRGEVGRFLHDRRECFGDIVTGEGTTPRHHFVQDAAERPDVRAFVGRAPARLLRRHVGGRAENHAHLSAWPAVASGKGGSRERRRILGVPRPRRTRRIHRFREPEVQHLHRAVPTDLDVRGLQIAMDDALLVRGFQGRRDLLRDRQRVGERHRTARDVHRQILALDELHDQGARARLSRVRRRRLFDPVDRGNVRMVQ